MLNGTTTQAGLKTLIAERAQADGTTGTGRLAISNPTATPTVVSVAEDAAGSPFGLKLSTVSSSLTGATVTGPSGSPPGVSIALGATNPNPGDQVGFTFNLPDGTTASVQLTATTTTPAPAGSFTIGTDPTATAGNLNTALNSAIGTLAGTTLVAASAVAAGDNFFNTASVATGSVVNNQATPPTAITGATALQSGGSGTDSLNPGFAVGDTITVNGTPITFVANNATGNEVNITDSVQTLLSKIELDHGHLDALDHRRRSDRNSHRRCGEPVDHKYAGDRAGRARLQRHQRDGAAAAAAGQRITIEFRDIAGERQRQHRVLVHRQFGAGIGARIVDRPDRFLDHGTIRGAGQ